MKKVWISVLTVMALVGCGRQAETEPTQVQPKQEITAEQAKSALCGQPMDITAEQLLINLDQGLRSTKAPTAIRDQKLTANDCGYTLDMVMDYGNVRLELDNQQKVRNLGVGYENIASQEALLKNMNNSFAALQTAVSVNGTKKFGETELGKNLFKALSDLIIEHKNVGSGTQDIDFDGKRYTVAVDGKTVAIIVRKIP